jgi:hypothetical protein
LFFSPLSYFDDPLEGISQKAILENHVNVFPTSEASVETPQNRKFRDDEKQQPYQDFLESVQKQLLASCWFLGIRESLAMWESYSNNDSVALRFKPDYLCDLMIKRFSQLDDKSFDVMAYGKVEYLKLSPLNANDASLNNSCHKFPGFIKDLSYKHEEEFRFLLMQQSVYTQYNFFEFAMGSLKNLEFNIITHPYMEFWKFKNIKTVLTNLGLEEKLCKSEIPIRRRVIAR